MARTILSLLLFVLMTACLVTACAAPAPNGGAPAVDEGIAKAPATAVPPERPSDDGEYPRPKPPLPSRDPLPPEHAERAPAVLDSSCKVDADCAVKNVGNCCGYYPACVNKNSPTDPAAVQAHCAKSGMMSVCGWKEISSCSCSQGKCEGNDSGSAIQ